MNCATCNIIALPICEDDPLLRTAYCPILALRTAYRHYLASRTAYRLTTKTTILGVSIYIKKIKLQYVAYIYFLSVFACHVCCVSAQRLISIVTLPVNRHLSLQDCRHS